MILTQAAGIGIGPDVDVARDLLDRGDYSEAFRLASRVFKTSSDPDTRVRALLTASTCASEQGRFAEAMGTLNLACPFVDRVTSKQKAKFYGQRAYLHSKLNDSENVLIDYEAARLYAKEAGEKVIEAQVRNNLAGCYRAGKRFNESLVESDAAISIVRNAGERLLLARFYDQKAQTLLELDRYGEAVACGKKAVEMLGDHPQAKEARETYGRALIAMGTQYLETEDPVDSFCAKRKALNAIAHAPTPEILQLALDRVGGHVSQASRLLGISYPTLIESVRRHGLNRKAPRRRAKSLRLK